jgi:hypothetical protein
MSWLSRGTAQCWVEPGSGQSEYVSNFGYHLTNSEGLGGCHVDRPSEVDDRRLSVGLAEFNVRLSPAGLRVPDARWMDALDIGISAPS